MVAAGEQQGFRLIFSTSEALKSFGEHVAKLLLLACCYQEGSIVGAGDVPVASGALAVSSGRVRKAYADAGHAGEVRIAVTPLAIADWLLAALRK